MNNVHLLKMDRVFVKAVYKYQARLPDEISLHINDVLQVKSQLDQNWYFGRSYKCEGNFPTSYVTTLCLPKVKEGCELFAALKSFHEQEDGDLTFNKGLNVKLYGFYSTLYCYYNLVFR